MPGGRAATIWTIIVLAASAAAADPSVYQSSASENGTRTAPSELMAKIRQGLTAFNRGEYTVALRIFDDTLPHVRGRSQVILTYNRATCLFNLERYADAEMAFATIARGDGQWAILARLNAGFSAVEGSDLPTALRWLQSAHSQRDLLPERYALLSEAVRGLADARRAALIKEAARIESLGQLEAARQRFQDALALEFGRSDEQTKWLNTRIDHLTARGQSTTTTQSANNPVSLWISTASGYDSNVGRGSTHAGDISFLGVGEGAPIFVQTVEIDGVLHRRSRLRVSVGYLYDLYAVLDDALETLSDQYHEFESVLGIRLTPNVDLRARLYGGMSAMEFVDPSLYQWHLSAQLRLRFWQSRRAMTELDLIGGRFFGLNDNDYLTGPHGRIDVGQRWLRGNYRFHAEARLRYRGAGQTAFQLLATDLVACDARCDGGSYTVTYAYVSPDVGVSVQYAGWGALRPQAAVRAGYRYFLDPHYASDQTGESIEESNKNRMDWLVSQSLGIRWQWATRWASTLRYTVTYNESNVDSSAAGAEHGWDYANRTYTQHALELELEWSLD
ncbi:MAG: hypothetical protein VX589_11850 [Myxococcota bacterium]|nr:hypothetical protein [Myxococcota bacterium]